MFSRTAGFLLSLISLSVLSGCGASVQSAHSTSVPTTASDLHTISSTSTPSSVYEKKSSTKSTSYSNVTTKKSKPVVQLPSVATQQQYLSELGYLPFNIDNGQLKWKYTLPKALTSQWVYGKWNELYRGALMQFQHESGITVDGLFGPQTWSKMKYALQNGIKNPHKYSYVYVSKGSPETLTLYYGGKVETKSLANTGIQGARTPDGTFPVYLRYRSQTMRGTDPNGYHYVDKGVPFVNYFYKGDAVHGFIRAHYGYPQSNGCVELPYSKAAIVWKYVNYGTLVTIS